MMAQSKSKKLPRLAHYRVLFEAGSFSGLSDGELLARFVSRENESAELAFAAIVERHASAVMHICRSVAGNEHDAEDAFQATFLVLATKAEMLRVRESLGPWLSAVAHRVSKGARAVALARTARELRAAALAAGRQSESDRCAEISTILHEEIALLPERYRLPLLLCDIDSCTQQEAARKLGWRLGTVKSRQARARARLRARLVRRGLHGTVPVFGGVGSVSLSVSESLIHSTSRAAARLLARSESAGAMSASVARLLKHFLRTTIVTRLTSAIGVVCLITAGIAATVMAQGQSEPKRPAPDPAAASSRAPAQRPSPITGEVKRTDPTNRAVQITIGSDDGLVKGQELQLVRTKPALQYEIRILKDGAPITPTMKLPAQPDNPSEFEIPEGTIELRFRPRGAALKNERQRRGPVGRRRTNSLIEEQEDRLATKLIEAELEIIKLESALKAKKDAYELNAQQRLAALGMQRDDLIREAFQNDTEVIALCEEIALADEQRAHARRTIPQGNDPARRRAEEKYTALREEYNKLWEKKYPELIERLKSAAVDPHGQESIEDLKSKLATLREKSNKLRKLLAPLKAQKRDPGTDDNFEEAFEWAKKRLDNEIAETEKLLKKAKAPGTKN